MEGAHTERRVVWPRYAAAFIKKAGGERAGRHTWHNEWLPIFLRRGLFLGINSTIGERERCEMRVPTACRRTSFVGTYQLSRVC